MDWQVSQSAVEIALNSIPPDSAAEACQSGLQYGCYYRLTDVKSHIMKNGMTKVDQRSDARFWHLILEQGFASNPMKLDQGIGPVLFLILGQLLSL